MSCVDKCRRLESEITLLRRTLTRREQQIRDIISGLKQIKETGDISFIDIAINVGGDMPVMEELNLELADEARKWIGVRELGGDNRGPEVEMFQRAVDGKAQGEPWCAAFAMFCLAAVEARYGIASRVHRSESVFEIWSKSPDDLKSVEPAPGYFACWIHGLGPLGHMEIVQRDVTKRDFKTVGGNTGDGSGVNRNGDGVYERLRSTSPQGKMRLLGFIRAF